MLVNNNLCIGCGSCSAECQYKAIKMEQDINGFIYPVVDDSLCVSCLQCESVCPILNPIRIETHNLKTYAGSLGDRDEVLKSSSGGAFVALANVFLQKKGYVCGVVYSIDFKSAYHICSNKLQDIEGMRGSKYIQSEITSEIYVYIRSLIEDGVNVLFTGTPCQISALNRYLGKEYQNLVTCDLICHGPTSQKIQKEYVEYLETKYSSKIKNFSMRHKINKCQPPYLKVVFENGKIFCKPLYRTHFGFAFSDIALRSCCYNCKFKDCNRTSDITIGDFWGIDNNYKYYNHLGTSVIIANTPKGIDTINRMEGFNIFESEYSLAVNGNPRLVASTPINPYTRQFYKLLNTKGLLYAVRKFNKPKTLIGYAGKYTPNFIKRIIKNTIKLK